MPMNWLAPDLIEQIKEQLGTTPEAVLYKNIPFVKNEIFVIPHSWGLQMLHEGNILREYYIGSDKIQCFFEEISEIHVDKRQQAMLHEYCLRLLKREYPNEY